MKNINKVLNVILVIILLPILVINMVILYDSFAHPDEVPSFIGWKPFIVLSSSMQSEINEGDLVIVLEVPQEEIKENDIVAYNIENVVITHRITEVITENGETRYVTKGDNNEQIDSGYITYDQVEGKYQMKVEGLGDIAIFLQTPLGMVVSLSVPIMLLLLIQLIENRRNKVYQMEKATQQQQMIDEIEKLKKQNDELLHKDDVSSK